MSFIKKMFGYSNNEDKKSESKSSGSSSEKDRSKSKDKDQDEIKPNSKEQDTKELLTEKDINKISFKEVNTPNGFDINKNLKDSSVFPPAFKVVKEKDFLRQNANLLKEGELATQQLYLLFLDQVKDYKETIFKTNHRPKEANNYYGGVDCLNQDITSLIRSAGTDLLKQVGKKIISGDFNLTTISFPIKIMSPYSILQLIAKSYFQFPYLMEKAKDKSALEKMKYVITASFASFFGTTAFLKPLNPVLGETYQGCWSDGSKMYLEQSSHHPPNSHFEIYGPDKNYYLSGYSSVKSSAGLNSVSVINKGNRTITFKDGTKIDFNFSKEAFSGVFMGALHFESQGELSFADIKNEVYAMIKIGGVKGKLNDNLSGEIIQNGKVVSKMTGNYLEHIDFDGVRYWDIRENYPISFIEYESHKNLPSSSLFREDRILLGLSQIDEAQAAKEFIENLQRHDRKMREKYHGKK